MPNVQYDNKSWAMMFVPYFLMASFSVNAETYLCVPEAGAYVSHNNKNAFHAGLADVSDMKLIQSNENGKWSVMKVGWDKPIFDKCQSPYYCESGSGYAGAFVKDKTNVFSSTWLTYNNGAEMMVVAKGMCTKIR